MPLDYKMKKKIFAFVGSLAIVLLPIVASAQSSTDVACSGVVGNSTASQGLTGVICQVKSLVNIAIPILMAAAFLFFIVQVIKFITSKDAEKRGDARSGMLQGIIGFACIVGLWGLVSILLSSFGANSGGAPNLPTF